MKLYKLTDRSHCTKNNTRWGENVTHELPATENPSLCSPDVLHAYTSPYLALLLNPIHADIDAPVLWEAEGEPCVTAWDKIGTFRLTTLRILPLMITTAQRARFAQLCARSAEAAEAAEAAARYAAEYDAARYAAGYAAEAAAEAAGYEIDFAELARQACEEVIQ